MEDLELHWCCKIISVIETLFLAQTINNLEKGKLETKTHEFSVHFRSYGHHGCEPRFVHPRHWSSRLRRLRDPRANALTRRPVRQATWEFRHGCPWAPKLVPRRPSLKLMVEFGEVGGAQVPKPLYSLLSIKTSCNLDVGLERELVGHWLGDLSFNYL